MRPILTLCAMRPRAISMASLEYAKDKIMMGAERETAIISEETIKR